MVVVAVVVVVAAAAAAAAVVVVAAAAAVVLRFGLWIVWRFDPTHLNHVDWRRHAMRDGGTLNECTAARREAWMEAK